MSEIEDLKRQMAELAAKLAAAEQAAIQTQGGAAVQGSVDIKDGNFIGRDAITLILNSLPNEDQQQAQSVITCYLQALAKDLAGVRLGEIDTSIDQSKRERLELADIYVPLNTSFRIPIDHSLAQAIAEYSQLSSRRDNMLWHSMEGRQASALEALSHHRTLTLLGKPGSGKSTLANFVLFQLSQACLGDENALSTLGDEWRHGKLFPIRIILRRFAEYLARQQKTANAGEIWAFIAQDLQDSGWGMSERTADYIQAIARSQGALIVFDGLDECGIHQSVIRQAVQQFQDGAGKKCCFLLTARPYAWPEGTDAKQGVYALADLDDAQIELFIERWYAALIKRGWQQPGDAERKKQLLLNSWQRADLVPLARIPLLLTLMVTLHTNQGRLPDDRADLYEQSVELLLLRWNVATGSDKSLLEALNIPGFKLSTLREVLEEIAFQLHQQNQGKAGTADIGEFTLLQALSKVLQNSLDNAKLVIEYIEQRVGLLIGQGEHAGQRQFTFPHRTFQEFLAACYLAAKRDFAEQCCSLAEQDAKHWQVVLALAARIAKAERGAYAADALVHSCNVAEYNSPTRNDWLRAQLAAQQLLEIGLDAINSNEQRNTIKKRVVSWLLTSLPLHPQEGGLPAAQRAMAGDLLAQLGDPRFNADRCYLPNEPELGFVHIAADPNFKMGDKQTLAPSPEFYIAKYPITVAQFAAFVTATQRDIDRDALADPSNRPVRWVNWHEALAYCDWLNQQLAALDSNSSISQLIQAGWQVALPSELEWEKAARGGLLGMKYPWGDEFDAELANTAESGIDTTSSVGCFPANAYGLYDISGNMWEWTRSLYDSGLDSDMNDEEWRVVRGGSWDDRRVFARCAFRLRLRPDLRLDYLGFRVVLRFPLIETR